MTDAFIGEINQTALTTTKHFNASSRRDVLLRNDKYSALLTPESEYAEDESAGHFVISDNVASIIAHHMACPNSVSNSIHCLSAYLTALTTATTFTKTNDPGPCVGLLLLGNGQFFVSSAVNSGYYGVGVSDPNFKGWRSTADTMIYGNQSFSGSGLAADSVLGDSTVHDADDIALLTKSYHVDASRVRNDTIETAKECLRLLKNFPRSQVTSSDEGEVAFYWLNRGNKVDAYLDSSGHFTWVGRFDGKYEAGGDEIWQHELPSTFVEMLNRLFE